MHERHTNPAQYRKFPVGIRADVFEQFDKKYPCQADKVYVVEKVVQALVRYGDALIQMLDAMEQFECKVKP